MMHDTILHSLPAYSLCAAIIDLRNIIENYRYIKHIVRPAKCSAVVKADAYGLGAEKISRVLANEGCREFFVATISEGIALRGSLPNKDINIYVLSGVWVGTEDVFVNCSLVPVISTDKELAIWGGYAEKEGYKLPCVLHIDTGLTRNGFLPRHFNNLISHANLERFDIKYVMSHLACPDTPGHPLNQIQLRRFKTISRYFPDVQKSLAATNGVFLGQEYFFDMVRPGKGLYGFAITPEFIGGLKPVVSLYARVLQINEIEVGESVGYGATFIAERKMRLATVGMGYADGLFRKFSSTGYGYLGSQKLPIVGRISMDYTVLDVTDVPDNVITSGSWVSFANDIMSLEGLALDNNTIPHEITCRLGPRVDKVYLDLDGSIRR